MNKIKKKNIKRLLAAAGVVLLAALYLITLICAIFDMSMGMVMFKASVMCTILAPILLWGYMVIYRIAKGKNEQELNETLHYMESNRNKFHDNAQNDAQNDAQDDASQKKEA